MKINFEIHANTTYYFNVEAHLEIKGHGEIDLMGDDYDYIPENMSKEEFVDWIYDTYLIDYNLNEDNEDNEYIYDLIKIYILLQYKQGSYSQFSYGML